MAHEATAALPVGFLGAGLIARYHAASLQRSGAPATIVAVHDPDAGRAAAFAAATGAQVGADADAVLDCCRAVYVCTWTSEHAAAVVAAAARGLAVFCEKPLATDLAGAEAMSAAVAAAGVVNQVGLVLRSSSGFALLRHLVSRPEVGRVVSVAFRDDQELPVGGYYGSTWRGDRHRAGSGTLLEHSIHDLDLLEWLLGPLAGVSARAGNLHGLDGIEDSVAVAFPLASGGTGVLTSVWHDLAGRLSSRHLEVLCERGRFWAEGNMGEVVGAETRVGEPRVWPDLAASAAELDRLGVARPGNADADFVTAVRAGGPASPDFAVALRAHRLVDAVYRSAAAGGGAVDL